MTKGGHNLIIYAFYRIESRLFFYNNSLLLAKYDKGSNGLHDKWRSPSPINVYNYSYFKLQ